MMLDHFIRGLFSILGLNLSQRNEITPSKLSFTLHLTSIRPALTNLWLNNINSLKDSNNVIKVSNESFRIIDNSHNNDLSQAQQTPSDDNMNIPNSIIVYHDQPPPLSITPFFNFKDFFDHLSKERIIESDGGNKMEFGSTVLYGEVISSTQTLLDKNFKFTQTLPTGFVCVASQQNQGRGRGKNSWISPLGCLQFSVVLKHPSNISSVVFIQYLLSLAVVEAIRTKKGYEDLPLRLKWPNDIYTENIKIGGVIINSHFLQDEFLLIAGCGVNLSNSAPTTAINRIISLYNHENNTQLEEFSQEQLLAAILVKFESFYKEFCSHKNGFEPFLDIYYKRWLHNDQIVTLEAFNNRRARIIGITTDFALI
ncbi:12887_t:CDS:2 [Funneliformis mosseae]|uniref:12887_t:CDS:1 n=1 Tax=Funneliformis mosseae TaxID=27381 RepID=A0A9N8W137_FUNMO|nr:12887_t:CDS:2 [Funneliformis mosseae]